MSGKIPQDEEAIPAGALNLLSECVHCTPRGRLLIVEEPDGGGYYDDEAPRLAAASARALGLRVYETVAPPTVASAAEMEDFVETLRGFDHVLFFSRIGDQIRFTELPGMPKATMCYALDREMLFGPFGTTCHQGMCELKAIIDEAFACASYVTVTCPRGTRLEGRPRFGPNGPVDVTLQRFPMLVPRPVPSAGMRGRIAISRFLVGTGSRPYEPYWLALEEDVFACVEDNRIVDISGPASVAAAVGRHYRQVARRFGLDPWFVHSWHAGIHPGCGFGRAAQEDMLRWSGSAFGSPRILHFHTCGDYAPGEISWNLFDPTVTVDGIALWEQGVLHPERIPGGVDLLARHPRLAVQFSNPRRDVGVD
ncbi:MAG: hypothetical protein AAFR46_19975 [Pseudomonadota bacterium]